MYVYIYKWLESKQHFYNNKYVASKAFVKLHKVHFWLLVVKNDDAVNYVVVVGEQQ